MNKIIQNKTKKQPICSPVVKKKGTINNNSCLTPNILLLIKDEFNKLNPLNKIKATKSNDIWNEMQSKMKCQSTNDECWYSKIKNKNLRDKITKYIYAPTHPSSWNKNKNEWLSNIDILKVLKQYEITYSNFKFFEPTTIDFDVKLAVNKCVSDEICNIDIMKFIKDGKTEFGFIFNLDNHNGHGTHWVSFYFSIKDKFCFYFDSVGESIPKEIKTLKNRIIEQIKTSTTNNIKFYQNSPFNHQKGNNECGMYSLYFITTMLTRKIDEIPVTTNTLIKFFKGKYNGRITDSKMNDTRWKLFNKPNDE